MSLMIISSLTKSFGAFTAVQDVSFSVGDGEIFAFLGPNGAGKTTTLRILMGILQPTSGTASIGGFDCFSDRVAVKRLVGYLPDEPVFYDYMRGAELICFVGEMHGLSAAEIQRVSMPLIEQFQLDDALEEYAVNYSHGMKKKLAFVCAMLHDPQLLLLDEPTNGLDPHSTKVICDLLRARTAGGKSTFFSTHLLDQAQQLCDRVGILHHGQLAAVGPIEELRNDLVAGGSLQEVFFAVTETTDSSVES
jgi:ABC-2 type transport system ATP-binding protein